MLSSFLAGLALQASLIVAIGPQNAFILRQGLRREHVGPAIALCIVADIALMSAGVAGLGTAVRASPGLLLAATWAGAAFLVVYGGLALTRAIHPDAIAIAILGVPQPRERVLAQAAAFTFLNPHVYLDTVLLVGAVGASQPGRGPLWFLAGASTASAAWFCLLGLGAQLLGPRLARPRAWRFLDLGIGVAMCTLAIRLVA